MFRNYLRTAIRNAIRGKGYTIINIFGLAIGIVVFLLVSQYVRFEHSYENFVPDRANIYRVSLETYRNNEQIAASAENYPLLGSTLKNEFPEVTAYARLFNMGYINNVVITNEQARPNPISYEQHLFFYADSAFLPMMGYKMLRGDAITALAAPNSAVISETYARLYFGNEDPIGKVLHMHDDDSNDQLVKVTGVFKTLPANTSLKFDVLFSFAAPSGLAGRELTWSRPDKYTFIRLRPGTNPLSVEAKLPALFAKHRPEMRAGNEKQTGRLQPLQDIHLRSDLAEELEANGNEKMVFFLNLVGIFVLLIAWINYINLSTARAIVRAKEVGVRKMAGALKSQLISQFLTEAALTNLVSLLIAYTLAILALPYFNTVSGLSLDLGYLIQPWFLGLCLALWLTGTLLSGLYPAFVLSHFKPIAVLKGKLKNSSGGIALRKGLVVAQFSASVILIAGTIIIFQQLTYMRNQDLGMNIDQVLVMDRPAIAPNHDKNRDDFRYRNDLFRSLLKNSPGVEGVSNSSTVPGKPRVYTSMIKRYGSTANDSHIMRTNSMDYDFMNVFKMQLLAGRNFSPEFPKDPDTSAIITATGAKLLGFKTPEEAIGKTIVTDFNWNPVIVGVVNDYHQVSFKKPLEPTLFSCDNYEGDYFSIRLHSRHLAETIQQVELAWKQAFPGNPFEYFFLDEYFNRQYSNEQKFGQLFTTLSMLAIFISCLGLFGLAAYTASQRAKEIGIRKVMGASVGNITTMLSKDFLKLVFLSILVASPLTWIVMASWLKGFAYRINIHWWVFGLTGMVTILIALGTVSFQAIRAAVANPVKSLRSE